jgi:hypothetical protein
MATSTRFSSAARIVVLPLLGALLIGCAGSPASVAEPAAQGGRPLAAAPFASAAPASDEGADPAAPRDGTRIVRTGSLGLKVRDVVSALDAAQRTIDGLGGYVGASSQATTDDRPVAQVSYRIPADRWDEAVRALRALGSPLEEQTEALEVTGQLVDLAARIENLRASERALQGIASSATRVSDVLEVQARLFEVRGQIEQLSAQRAHLEDQASYGTLTVTFGVEVVAITEAARGWNAGEEVDRATASLVDVLQALATAGIWIAIVWLPILLALGVIVAGVVIALRRLGIVRRSAPAAPAG